MKPQKKKFIVNAFVFALGVTFIIWILNCLYVHAVLLDKVLYRREDAWQAYRGNISDSRLDYAFFGDSHAVDGLNPRYIGRSYNFAQDGEDYVETFFRLKKIYEKDEVRMDTIVLELDLQTFSGAFHTPSRLFAEPGFYRSFVSLDDMSRLRRVSRLHILFSEYVPVVGKGFELVAHWIAPPSLTPIELGWSNNTKNFKEASKDSGAEVRFKDHFGDTIDLRTEPSFAYFLKTVEWAKGRNISIVFIIYPVSEEYAAQVALHNISREEHYEGIFSEISKITDDFIVLDYYRIFFAYPEYIADADHVNGLGSEVLSIRFLDDMGMRSEKVKP